MKIAIFGASGFIGSNLVSEFSKGKSNSLIMYDRTKDSFNDKTGLLDFLKKADVVFHLAGIKKVKNKRDWRFNVDSTLSILSSIQRTCPGALLIFPSSFAVYRIPTKGEIIDESFELLPRNDYGRSKLKCEKLIEEFSSLYGLRSIIFRISNIYGKSDKTSDSIMDAIKVALYENRSLVVEGDGEQTRDFIHVSDVVCAFSRTLSQKTTMKNFEVFNLCTGKETSINDLVTLAGKITQKKIPVKFIKSNAQSDGFWRGSFKKAKRILKWEPELSLRTGLKETFEI